MPTRKTSIVILTRNQLWHTALCIESIRRHTAAGNYALIVVDNHSDDGTVEWLRAQPDIRLIENEENRGFPAGCNQGIAAAEPDTDILLLNNDTMVTPRWLENLQTALYSAGNVGAVGPVSNHCSNGQQVGLPETDTGGMLRYAQEFNAQPPHYEPRVKLVGFCMLIRREAAKAVGPLDERFSPGNYEDDDYSFRLGQAGWRLLLCHSTFVYHSGSASFRGERTDYAALLARNAAKFKEKWGFESNYSTFVRGDVLALMDAPSETPLRVLDVGCACGATLLKIGELYPNAQLFGVEPNPSAASVAACFAQMATADIEREPRPFGDQTFDYILFSDVLEHLREPAAALRAAADTLAPGGTVLASIPNIQHYSVVNDLLHGRFSYADAGILDRTHLRFFTRTGVEELFAACGLTILELRPKPIWLDANAGKIVERLVTVAGEENREGFFTYQYLVKARRKATV